MVYWKDKLCAWRVDVEEYQILLGTLEEVSSIRSS